MSPFSHKNSSVMYFTLVFEFALWILCSAQTITEKCKVECNMKAGSDDNSERYECNSTCRTEECSRGCKLWIKSTNSSCINNCGISGRSVGVDICVQSCSKAVQMYINETTKRLKKLAGPVLMSSNNVSVMLRWSMHPLPSLEPGHTLTFLLQKFILGLSDDWQFHNSVKWSSGQRVIVFDLKPYVTYKFRVVVVIAGDVTEPLLESSPISTEPSGTPLQVPEVVSLTTTSTSVHLKAKPPFFINGPLIGFRLIVARSKRASETRVKEIISHGNRAISEVITMLQPDTEYEVRLATINRYGVGPEMSKTVRTSSQNMALGVSAFLLFCADNKLSKQDLTDMFIDPQIMFEDHDETVLLTEVAIHYRQQLIFLATNDEHIYRMNASDKLSLVHNVSRPVLGLTVDWLHDYLYLATENKILECDLAMESCHLAVDLKTSAVVDIHVDPCNGYLYWTQRGERNGLFSLDLDHLKDFDIEPNLIVFGNISAFTIDYLNYRLYYPNETIHAMISIYLDGTDPVNIRNNTQNPDFSLVTGLTYNEMNRTFFWTNGEKLLMEELDVNNNLYHHNEMFMDGYHFGAVGTWGLGSQPIPVPILPPRQLQALLSANSAILSWLPPESDQGKGAWQRWTYEVEIANVPASRNQTFRKTDTAQIRIVNLVAGTLYRFRVRGTSAGGKGPWSDYFTAQTLTAGPSTPFLLYACGDGLFEMTLDGFDTKFMPNSIVYNETITELIVSSETVFLTTSSGLVYSNPRNQSALAIPEITDAGVLAFDWLTNRIYWTNTKLNLIKRMSLEQNSEISLLAGRDETLIYASSGVLDLAIDIMEARMYWTTTSTIETAYLDGQSHQLVQKLPSFSSQYILGLTVDKKSHLLFWMVKNINKITIYKTQLISLMDGADFQPSIENVLEVASKVIHPSLEFHSSKLFWMEQKNMLSVLDLKGHSIAQIHLAADTEVTAFTLASSKDLDNSSFSVGSVLFVIPDSLDMNALIITQLENDFNISWSPLYLSCFSCGPVSYRVWLQVDGYHRQEKHTYSPYVLLLGLKFYSEIEVTIVACSFWGCGGHLQKTFHSLLAEKSVQGQLTFALSTSFGVILILTMIAFFVLLLTCLGHKDRKTIFSIRDINTSSAQNNDHELATLRHLPSVALETANVLYASSFLPGNEEISSLPHFPHCRLRLTKFLGSGAFGKVFEGVAVNILHENSGETKVAVKTLHKSASDNEKEEFLKEALLMNNFKHDHILRLLGVSLDHDPQFLILELMDGGDLLTFLRASRPSFVADVKLTASDMIGICMDVGKGCEYLEDMHFVHRDLAARNCLVSFAGSGLVVKIGDFGLARDIYRNDYYKKEGEGLLPVRWMSPESLIDGIFTTQSDVWAFGVLMWEVLTLGQQPYPAQTNLEVLHFVRSGGRLDCPENCPNDLYQLMLKCWLYLPLKRPSFHDIVKQLNILSQQATTSLPLPSADTNCLAGHGRLVRKNNPKSRYSEDDSGSTNSDGRYTDNREFRILDPSSFMGHKSNQRKNSFLRQSDGCQGDNFEGSSCGYLEPSRQLHDQHPKYLELIDLTLPLSADTSSIDD